MRGRLPAAAGLAALFLLAFPSPAEPSAGTGGAPTEKAPEASGDRLTIRYLGSAGLSLRSGGHSILTAPFFSNPGLFRVVFLPIAPDPAALPGDLDEITRDARAILVGHAHYDHLLDVPLVAERLPEGALIYGSRTAAHILAGAGLDHTRVVAVNALAGTPDRPGRWITAPGGAVRFMPIHSGHAPHFAGMRFYDGIYRKDWSRLPRFASQWRLGQPFTYVIDFLDPAGGPPRWRIFYQDAASDPPLGLPPPLEDGKDVDLAVLCVASFSQVKDHPEAVVRRLRPRAVLLAHWEDFFRPRSRPVRPVRGTDVDEFVRRLEAVLDPATPWWMPDPGTILHLPAEPRRVPSPEPDAGPSSP